ncbi:unnamed protein product [Linum tenue]
MEDPD